MTTSASVLDSATTRGRSQKIKGILKKQNNHNFQVS